MSLVKLLNSPLKIRMLEWMVTHPKESPSISELSRLLGAPKSTVSLAIKDWDEEGLVFCPVYGKNKCVKVSDGFFLWPTLKKLFTMESSQNARLIDAIRKQKFLNHKEIYFVTFFGSRARGDHRMQSDADLLIVAKDDRYAGDWMDQLASDEIHSRILISPVFLQSPNFELRLKERDPFVQNIIREGVVIKGKDWLAQQLQKSSRSGERTLRHGRKSV